MAQQPHAIGVRQYDTAEMVAADVGEPVMAGQLLVDEGVVGLQQIQHAAVLAEDGINQKFGFLSHRLLEAGIELRRHRRCAVQQLQRQPLRRKIAHQRR